MTLLTRLGNVRTVWQLLLPAIPPPSDTWMAKWVALYSDDIIEEAISATAKQARKPGFFDSPEAAHRYTTATCRQTRQRELQAAATALGGEAI